MIVTAFLALNGDDRTAVLGDKQRPFLTYTAAASALLPHKEAGTRTNISMLGFVQPVPEQPC